MCRHVLYGQLEDTSSVDASRHVLHGPLGGALHSGAYVLDAQGGPKSEATFMIADNVKYINESASFLVTKNQ